VPLPLQALNVCLSYWEAVLHGASAAAAAIIAMIVAPAGKAATTASRLGDWCGRVAVHVAAKLATCAAAQPLVYGIHVTASLDVPHQIHRVGDQPASL
jgi:hypothetical protein